MTITAIRKPTLAVAVLLAALAVSGCTKPKAPATAPSSDPSPTSTIPAAQQKAIDEAWAQFGKLQTIYNKASQTGDYAFPTDKTQRALYQAAAGIYQTQLEADLDLLRQQGYHRTGEPLYTQRRVVSVSATSVTIETCADNTNSNTVDRDGKPVGIAGQNKKFPVTLRAELYPDTVWRWVESKSDRNSTC